MTFLPQLEQDLFNAAKDRLRAPDPSRLPETTMRPPLRRLRALASSLPGLLSVGVAIAIAVIALTALKSGHQSAPTAVRGSGIASGTPPRRELLRTIGVLRRPQRRTDLNCELQIIILNACLPHAHHIELGGPAQILARWGYPELDRPLLRVVSIPAWGAKVLIAPTTYQPSPRSRHRSEGIDLVIKLGGNVVGTTGTGPRPTTVTAFLRHGLSVFTNGPNDTDRGALLVPDGVAKVSLGSFRLPGRSAPSGVNPKALATATDQLDATAAVNDNVAALQLSVPALTSPKALSGLYGMPSTAQATWFNSRGQIVKRTTTEVDFLVRIRGGRRIPPRVLNRLPPRIRVRFCHQHANAC